MPMFILSPWYVPPVGLEPVATSRSSTVFCLFVKRFDISNISRSIWLLYFLLASACSPNLVIDELNCFLSGLRGSLYTLSKPFLLMAMFSPSTSDLPPKPRKLRDDFTWPLVGVKKLLNVKS